MAGGVARGAALGILGRGWHLVTGLVLYAFLARWLGPGLFGKWSVALSVLAWFEVFVMTALVPAATKAIGEQPQETPSLAKAAYLGQGILAAVVFLTVQVTAGGIARALGDPDLAILIRISALDIPLYAMFMIASAVTLGIGDYRRQGIAWVLYATAKAGFIGLLVALGFSVPGALVGNALSSLVGFAAVVSRLEPVKKRSRETWTTVRWMALAALPFLVLGLTDSLGQNVDLWIVSATTRDTAVGWYASAAALAAVPVFLFLGLNRVIFPSVIAARAAGDVPLADRYTAGAIRTILIVTVMGVAFTVSAGRQVIELVYSSRYLPAYLPLCVLMVAGMGRAIHATCTEVLLAEDRRFTAVGILGTTVLAEMVLVWLLVGRLGILGAAIGTATSTSIAAIWAGIVLHAAIGWRPLLTLVRAVPSAAVIGAAIWVLAPSPLLTPFVAVIALVVYLWLLLVMREFTADELASARAIIRR